MRKHMTIIFKFFFIMGVKKPLRPQEDTRSKAIKENTDILDSIKKYNKTKQKVVCKMKDSINKVNK